MPSQVWATDITWIPLARGYLYLTAVMDLFSRYILSWRLSDSLESDFCVAALEEALRDKKPSIFNTDQGTQFTSTAFINVLKKHSIKISMDGKGRYCDNILVERLWRSVKYEEIYPKEYDTGQEALDGLEWYVEYYNNRRPHQALGYRTPAEVYLGTDLARKVI